MNKIIKSKLFVGKGNEIMYEVNEKDWKILRKKYRFGKKIIWQN